MQTIHFPQRLTNESLEAYRDRRRQSREAVQRMSLTGSFRPDKGTSRQEYRQSARASGSMKRLAGNYGRGLRNHITRKQAAALA